MVLIDAAGSMPILSALSAEYTLVTSTLSYLKHRSDSVVDIGGEPSPRRSSTLRVRPERAKRVGYLSSESVIECVIFFWHAFEGRGRIRAHKLTAPALTRPARCVAPESFATRLGQLGFRATAHSAPF